MVGLVVADYEADLCIWANHNAALLRAGQFAEIDVAHIAEELEDMSKRERRALRSYLRNLTMHLLKWQFQPSHRSVSWRMTILNSRLEILAIIADSPSLKQQITEYMMVEYAAALAAAVYETGLPMQSFPPVCPYTAQQLLDNAYWPED